MQQDFNKLICFSVDVAAGVANVLIKHGDMNLLDRQMMVELNSLAGLLEKDPQVKVIVFRSADPDFFIAHADLNLILDAQGVDYDPAEKLVLMNHVVERFRLMPKVSIAQIDGQALGGGMELAIGLDMCFAAENSAKMGQPEVALGIIPGGGGCARLPLKVGRNRALEIILGCNTLSAQQAESYGYINRAIPDDQITAFVDNLAKRIATFPDDAIVTAKQVINEEGPDSVEARLFQEQVAFKEVSSSPAATERMSLALQRGFQQREVELSDVDDFLQSLNKQNGDI